MIRKHYVSFHKFVSFASNAICNLPVQISAEPVEQIDVTQKEDDLVMNPTDESISSMFSNKDLEKILLKQESIFISKLSTQLNAKSTLRKSIVQELLEDTQELLANSVFIIKEKVSSLLKDSNLEVLSMLEMKCYLCWIP